MFTVKTQVQHTAHNTEKKFRRPGRKDCEELPEGTSGIQN